MMTTKAKARRTNVGKVHGNTIKAADLALMRKDISSVSHRAVLAGQISLKEAKAIGRDGAPTTDAAQGQGGPGTATGMARSARAGGTDAPPHTPPQPVSRISKDDHTPTKTPCFCGCGTLVGSRFAAGHDMRMFRVAREHLTEGRELTEEQREYLETSGKMERVKKKLAEEERKRQQTEARKAERMAKRMAKAEAKAKDAK